MQIQPIKDQGYTNSTAVKLPPKNAKGPTAKERDGLGPGTYTIKQTSDTPIFSFGTRFNSSIRSKEHLRPTKVDGPGPGAYKLPSGLKNGKRAVTQENMKLSTFGNCDRNFSNLPKDIPGPGKYFPV